ncbi:DUF4870 domain-containing protein [Cryobacterium psychrophilum]|uniref:DUF4870 domain-containing protein n=1 Tax=Cryobacterium psychrophilum TaxID=41988 RepID=A0A4Y8KMZ8_9MICO|nr:DUF4870 domain-containing protein [Cryobacterium psychrophilum]TDW31535.1 hypothetical protein EDD25_3354 [Cryobacterium psychrophilum]TFD79312.1 DUF4870 domain-containing protein [Cryobacterium psychrophilum]
MSDPNSQAPRDPDPGQNPPQSPYPAAPVAAPLTAAEDQQWASWAHLGGILWILPSLVIWLVFKDRGHRTNIEAKEALNFQITVMIAWFAVFFLGTFLALVTFGIGFLFTFLGFALWVMAVVFSIMGFLAVKDGGSYRYPVSVRFIK